VAVAELARTTTNETKTETKSAAASRARITELSSSPQLDVAAFTSRVSPEAASWGANCDACPVRVKRKQVAGELYRFNYSHSISFVLLTVFDGVIVYLTVVEYRKRRHPTVPA
jgi:hypothetical protein